MSEPRPEMTIRPADVDVAGLARSVAAMEAIADDLRLTAANPHVAPAVREAALAVCLAVEAAAAEAAVVVNAAREVANV